MAASIPPPIRDQSPPGLAPDRVKLYFCASAGSAATAEIASGETLGLFGEVTFTGVVTVAGEMVVV